jgi:serine/threonine-protein kinase
MAPPNTADSGTGCPGRDELSAFGSGRLSGPDAQRVAEHVGSCAACEAVLAVLPEDPLIAALRGSTPAPEDPELLRLEAFARGLSPRPGDLTATGDDTVIRPGRDGVDVPCREFGPYELLGEPFRGGMGVVWRARHRVLNVVRALKMLPTGAEADAEAVTRFCVEGEAAARLDHPHIVRLHEFDEHDGRLYYTMEYLEGGTLAQRLQAGPVPAAQAARLVATLACAVEHAHRRQVVHRDLKPSNVLFAADGTVKLADFGLAKMLDETGLALTQTQAALGTAGYMAPEQAAGHAREATPAMDVWALGAILYECLTGRPAFRGHDRRETLDLVRRARPTRPSALCTGLPPGPEAICMKCLRKDPADRYAGAGELADDLERWLCGVRPAAQPPPWPVRLARAARRHPVRAATLVTAALATVLVPAALWLRSPERVARANEAALAGGEAVTLIARTGAPAWSELILGQDKATLSGDRQGCFALASSGESFLELLRDPGRERYRLRAEVNHLAVSDNGAQVGLYFLRSRYPTPWGTDVHSFYRLAFNDLVDAKVLYDREVLPRVPAGAPSPPRPAGNPILLNAGNYGQDKTGVFLQAAFALRCSRAFVPRRVAGEEGWRRLAVRVTPDLIVAEWDGKEVARVTSADRTQDAAEAGSGVLAWGVLAGWRAPVAFRPRQALGLYVDHATASFRNVVVEPLDAGQ